MIPTLAIIGRPNVGKSSLFNVLTRSRQALVADEPGVTRDRQYGEVKIGDIPFILIDTGGMVTEADHRAWCPADLSPYVDVVADAFGEDRLMFGSDWPVCLLAASYEQTFAAVRDHAAWASPSAKEKFLGGNAARFYLGRRRGTGPES